jgi:hypothetical protein
MTVFGPLFGGDLIDAALLDRLKTWMATYLRAVSEDRGIDPLKAPRSIVVVSEFARFPEEQLPAIVVVNGASDTPVERPGYYDAKWPVEICTECSAGTQNDTRRNAQLYLVAARECLLRERSLGAGMRGVDWGGESYTLRDISDRRSIAGASAKFVIERENVAQIGGGPQVPNGEPYSEPHEATSVTAEVDKTN